MCIPQTVARWLLDAAWQNKSQDGDDVESKTFLPLLWLLGNCSGCVMQNNLQTLITEWL